MKYAFISPRYGAEIAGGAEHAARLIAEQLSDRHDVDVLTTTARDPLTWRNDHEYLSRPFWILVDQRRRKFP